MPEGDHRPRHVCTGCGTVHYQNPKIVAGCVPEHEGRILLCRRAIEPRHGYWTIPAGFMENGETTQDAARRESLEEALAEVEIGSLLAVVHVLHADQVHVMFRARLPQPEFGAGAESLEVMLCDEAGDPVARHRFPQRGFRAAPLPRGPARRPGAPPFHRHRPAAARGSLTAGFAARRSFGRIRPAFATAGGARINDPGVSR